MLMFMLLYRHSYLTLSLKIDFPVLICGVYKLGCREIVELEGISSFFGCLFVFVFSQRRVSAGFSPFP